MLPGYETILNIIIDSNAAPLIKDCHKNQKFMFLLKNTHIIMLVFFLINTLFKKLVKIFFTIFLYFPDCNVQLPGGPAYKLSYTNSLTFNKLK